jgi:hypothetical protein
MSAVAEVAQGTGAGEPAKPVAAPSAAPSEPQPTTTTTAPPAQPPQGVDWETVDPETLPKSFIAKVEQRKAASLDADYTRKTQALAEERRQFNSLVEKMLTAQTPAQPDEITQLRERIKQGEYDLLPDLNDKQMKRALEPIQKQNAIQQVVNAVQAQDPILREREADVFKVFSADPKLQQWAFSEPEKNLPYALQGIGLALRLQNAQAALQAEQASRQAAIDAAVKAELDKRIEQARGLPTTTSRAGTTPTGTPVSDFGGQTPTQKFVAFMDSQGKPVDPILRERAARGK